MTKKSKEVDDSRRYPTQPCVGIGIIIWRDDKVLLVKRGRPPYQGKWALPGGKQNLGETIMAAAVREAREETGLDITPLGIVTAIDAVTHDKAGKVEYHYTIVEVAAECQDGTAVASDDAAAVMWASVDEIERLCDWPEILQVVRLSALQRVL